MQKGCISSFSLTETDPVMKVPKINFFVKTLYNKFTTFQKCLPSQSKFYFFEKKNIKKEQEAMEKFKPRSPLKQNAGSGSI
jgi:hypothetical protein